MNIGQVGGKGASQREVVVVVVGGGGRLWGEGVQNSCLALVVMCEFDLLYCCSSETSLNPF